MKIHPGMLLKYKEQDNYFYILFDEAYSTPK